MRTIRWLVPAVLVAALSLSACGGGSTGGDDQAAAVETAEDGSGRIGSYPLHFRKPFPDLNVYALDGEKVSSDSLVEGKNSVVLFISTSCDVCAGMIETWRTLEYQIPDTMSVIAIVDEEFDFAREWAEQDQFPFPLYVDTRSAFALRHGVEHYPTAVGVAPDGTILYVRRGVSDMFTPSRAAKLLHRGAQVREERLELQNESEMEGEGDG